MNPTIWTAHQRSTDKQRRGSDERAMVLARWGGLGGHRYQVPLLTSSHLSAAFEYVSVLVECNFWICSQKC